MHMNKNELLLIVSNNIKKARKEKKMTQEQLAEYVLVSPSLIRKIESKKVNQGLSIQVLYRISVVLEKSIDYFFKESNDEIK